MPRQEKIGAGINYIRMLRKGMNVYDIAEEMEESVDHVKECMKLARQNKDMADQSVKVTLDPVELDIKDDYFTGAMQTVKKVEVELKKPIIAKYSTDKITEFETLMPVKVTIYRQ